MCEETDDKKRMELHKKLNEFGKGVIDKTNDIGNIEVDGVSIFR